LTTPPPQPEARWTNHPAGFLRKQAGEGGSWPKQNPRSALVRGAIARCPRAASTVELTARLLRAAHQPPATVDTRSVLVGTSGVSVAWPSFCDVDCDATRRPPLSCFYSPQARQVCPLVCPLPARTQWDGGVPHSFKLLKMLPGRPG